MIDYVYKARNNATGEIVTAGVKAENPQAAAKLLTKQNLFPLEITVREESNIFRRLGLKRRVSSKDRVLFTRQLSTLINAGLPLSKALRTVQGQIKNPTFKEVIDNIVATVEGGSSLSEAFAQHPRIFNQIYTALVAAGESSGTLDKTLMRLANQQEKEAAIVAKIRGALVYPAIVLVLIIAVVILMVVTVVPQVAKLYADLDKALPFLTQILLYVTSFITNLWWLAILVLVFIFFGIRALLKNERVRYRLDAIQLKLPLFGILFQKSYMARFSRTLSTLLASGIPMLEALSTAKGAMTNRLIAADVSEAITNVRGGGALSASFEGSQHIPQLIPQMIKIGEESGAIDDMLARTATYYEDEVDQAVKNLSTTLEPVMMVVLGGIVALVLGAVLYPIYSLVGSGSIR